MQPMVLHQLSQLLPHLVAALAAKEIMPREMALAVVAHAMTVRQLVSELELQVKEQMAQTQLTAATVEVLAVVELVAQVETQLCITLAVQVEMV